MFAASDPHGKSVTLLRAIGLRYGAVVIIGGGLTCLVLYLRGSEVNIFTAEGCGFTRYRILRTVRSRERYVKSSNMLY